MSLRTNTTREQRAVTKKRGVKGNKSRVAKTPHSEAAIGGAWEKGGPSPNPGGRPRQVREVAELARQCTEAAIVTLAEIMRKGKNESARVRAAEILLDRAWGKATQRVEVAPEELSDEEFRKKAAEVAQDILGLSVLQ